MSNISFIKKIDDLGRIVIPKEIRRILNIDLNENLEVTIENNDILIKKMNNNDFLIDLIGNLISIFTNNNYFIISKNKIIKDSDPSHNKESLIKQVNNSIFGDNEGDISICYDINNSLYYYFKRVIINGRIDSIVVIYSSKSINNEEKDKINKIVDFISNYKERN